MIESDRSMEKINQADLERIGRFATTNFADFVARNPRWKPYQDRIVAIALCQGAARHYLDGKHGVKDIDLWFFFAEIPGAPFPPRPVRHADFGPSKFGRGPETELTGRRVDLMGRSLPCGPDADPALAIKAWLEHRTASARALAEAPIVLLFPPTHIGEVVWQGAR